jgi:hypothetical protein
VPGTLCKLRLFPGVYKIWYKVQFGKSGHRIGSGTVELRAGHTYVKKGKWCVWLCCVGSSDYPAALATWVEDRDTAEVILGSTEMCD